MPRFYCPMPLSAGATLVLPAAVARHVRVLRLQLADGLTLFNGQGGEYSARIEHLGPAQVRVQVLAHTPTEREARPELHLALGMPANERMDWLLEKATELGMASLQPLQTERSVLRLSGERAERKRQHWQGIALAACEQCGRNRVPEVHPVASLAAWLGGGLCAQQRLVLSLAADSIALGAWREQQPRSSVLLLSGPEGGLSNAEEAAARAAGFIPVSLGPRTLRADTAPLAALAALTLGAQLGLQP